MRPIFTIPDPDITQDSSVDPMGIRIIWTYYGQSIFKEKLTTIANDVRIFTINLFHHHLINRLFQDYPEEIQFAKKRFKHWSTDLDVRTGLLIFLEDLATWSFYESKQMSYVNLNSLGMFGLSKAHILMNTLSPHDIYLHAYKKEGSLKKQLTLGMTGRYKGPMIKMGFFNSTFEVSHSEQSEWEKINKLIEEWKEVSILEQLIIKLFIENVISSSKKDHPQISYEDLKQLKYWNKIREGYIHCFGSEKPVYEVRRFWKDKLGLISGAAGALYNQFDVIQQNEPLNHELIFRNALHSLKNNPNEYEKLDLILNIEPFLSHAEYLLRFLSQIGIKNIYTQAEDLELLRSEIVKASNFNLSDSPIQLKELHHIATLSGTIDHWIRSFLDYHKKVMLNRGSNVWVEMDNEGNLKHYFAPVLDVNLNKIPSYLKLKPWWHTYYLETLRSIHKGLS